MKSFRKLLCLLLALCSLVSMTVPAMATEITEAPTDELGEIVEGEITEIPEEELIAGSAQETEEIPEHEAPVEPEGGMVEGTEETLPENVETEQIQGPSEIAEASAAESGTWENLTWSYNNGTLSITGSGEMKYAYYSNYPWHSYRGQVTKVVVGDYVTSINTGAFRSMGNLNEVTLGARLVSIGTDAFYDCGNLLTITIPASVTTIGESAFSNCGNLTEILFKSGSKLTTINSYAFNKCANLLAVDFPNSLMTIGSYAFQNCSNLVSVTFGSKLESIGYQAFYRCVQLVDAYFPASLRTINGRAFMGCTNLVAIELQYGLETLGSEAFYDCVNLSGYVKIPGTVSSVGSDCFKNCSKLESVDVYACSAIGNSAFRNCTSLSDLTIGGTVTGIGEYTFEGCTALTTVNIPGSVNSIGYRAFRDCTNLSKVTFASGLNTIGSYAFYNCALTSLKLPNSVTAVKSNAFENNKSLTTAALSTGMTAVSGGCFKNCSSLTSVTLGDNVNTIDDSAFENCTLLSTINWPSKLNTIGDYAFKNCDSLISVVLPSALNTISYHAFNSCDLLNEVVLERNVTSIGGYAFAKCPSLMKFTNYATNTSYSDSTFYNSGSVTMYGWADSTSETFANEESIPFVAITSLDTPENKKICNVVSGVHVYWNYVPGASYYTVYRADSANGNYKIVKSVCAATHYIDTTAVSGKTYYYKVQAKNGQASSGLSAYQTCSFVGTPDITSRINKAAGIQLGWDEISGATGYAIYRKPYEGNAAWSRVATITGGSTTSWTDTSVKNSNGTVYKYTIRALYGSTLSGCRNTGRTMVRLCSQVMNSAAKTGTASIKCSWTTSKVVTGYEVRFVVDGVVYKTYTIGNYATGVKTFSGLATGRTYQIQVRTYKKVDGVGSFYSAWSTAKYVTL